MWLSLGTVAFDLLLAVLLSSLVRDRLSYRAWRAVHWLAYAAGRSRCGTGSAPAPTPGCRGCSPSTSPCVAAVAARLAGGCRWRSPGPRRTAGIIAHIGFPLATAYSRASARSSPAGPGAPARPCRCSPPRAWSRRRPADGRAAAPGPGPPAWASMRRCTARCPGLCGHRPQTGAAGLADAVGRGGPDRAWRRRVPDRREDALGGVQAGAGRGRRQRHGERAGSEKDQALLARAPHLVLDGAVLAAEAVGADAAHLCLPPDPALAQVQTVSSAVRRAARAGLGDVPITVHALPHHYVASEETSLISWLNGGEAKPTATPPRPFERGVGGGPRWWTTSRRSPMSRSSPGTARPGSGRPDRPTRRAPCWSPSPVRLRMPGVYEIEAWHAGRRRARHGRRRLNRAAPCCSAATSAPGTRPATSRGPADRRLRPARRSARGRALACSSCSRRALRAGGDCPDPGYLAEQSGRQCGPCIFGLPAIADDFTQLASAGPDGDLLGRLERGSASITGRGACRHPDGAIADGRLGPCRVRGRRARARRRRRGLRSARARPASGRAVRRRSPGRWPGGAWR